MTKKTLQSHFHLDCVVWVIILENKILKHKIIDAHFVWIDFELREGTRFAQQLFFERLDVVLVHMSVRHTMDKISWYQTAYLRNHTGKQRIRCNIEWNT